MNNRQPYNIETIAAYILKNIEYPYEAMKIQKLCFYTQAWFLASHGEPFFHHDFEAWRSGPVSPSLYKYHLDVLSSQMVCWLNQVRFKS